ncbi:MAG: DNA-directed RNA polymerase subunit omega [Acidaminococcaceae bacterium]
MIEPSIDYLAEQVDSKYTLVVLAAKRARELMNGAPNLVETKSNKPVTIALEEVGAHKITYERTKTGIK